MSLLASRTPALQVGALPRVDLLPPSEVRRRDVRAQARIWVWVAFGAIVVAVVAVGAAFALNMAATLRLASEQSRTLQIMSGIAELSDVSTALSTRTELEGLGESAMSGDLEWRAALDLVAAHLPAGVTITEFALDAGAAPVADADPTAAVGLSGTVTFTSTAPLEFVDATRELRSAEGMLTAELDDYTSSEGTHTYRVAIEIDQSIYLATEAAE